MRRTVLLLAAAGSILATTALPAAAAPTPRAATTAAAPQPFLTAVTDRGTAAAWSTFTLVGKLSPALAGERIAVQRKLGTGPWTSFAASTVTRADGTYVCPIASGRPGMNQFRTVRFAVGGRPTVVSNVTGINIR